jgi:hypothetical protein
MLVSDLWILFRENQKDGIPTAKLHLSLDEIVYNRTLDATFFNRW